MSIKLVLKLFFVLTSLISIVPMSLAAADIKAKEFLVVDKPYEELNKMEILANQARELYWKGEYQKSLDIFLSLNSTNHPSTPMYYNEMAQSNLALGDFSSAEKHLRNVDNFFLTYNSAGREEKVLSNFGEEAKKIYLGDPYERATNYLLLSLIYIDRGDYEKALAACKSGILESSDAKGNQNEGDYALLQLLEMKLISIIGKNDIAANFREKARKTYINTHPLVRDLVSERLDKIEMMKLSDDERNDLKIKEKPNEIKALLVGIEDKLALATAKVDPERDLDALLSGNYNTLIVVPFGKGPTKGRKGKDGQIVTVNTDSTIYQRPSIIVDGRPFDAKPVNEVANLNFQSVTRGGRKMDAILQGKAAFRDSTALVGKVLSDVGSQIFIGFAIIGAITEGVAGAMSPEADTRTWQTLPANYEVYALNLSDGEHEIKISDYVYFEKQKEIIKKVKIGGEKKLVAVIAPPSQIGRYSEVTDTGVALRNNKKIDAKEKNKISILITPPLGLKKIVRIPSPVEGERSEAIAPDWKKIVRRVEKKLSTEPILIERVGHQDIVNKYSLLATDFAFAFQTEIEGLDMKMEKDDKIYSMQVIFTLVSTETGLTKNKGKITGVFRKNEDDKTSNTEAYYKCFDDALDKFMKNNSLVDMIKLASQ